MQLHKDLEAPKAGGTQQTPLQYSVSRTNPASPASLCASDFRPVP